MAKAELLCADGTRASIDISPAFSILVAAQRAGAALRHDCGGKALCGTCRVRVISGRLSPVMERERRRLDAVGAGPGVRLACQARPGSDVSLEAVLPLAGQVQPGQQEGRAP
jgi:adenylate cyclase